LGPQYPEKINKLKIKEEKEEEKEEKLTKDRGSWEVFFSS